MEPLYAGPRDRVLQAKLRQEEWRKIDLPPMPVVPDSLPARWRSLAKAYTPFFQAFREVKGPDTFVAGDTTVGTMFAYRPFRCIDASTCFGASVPLRLVILHNGHACTTGGQPIAPGLLERILQGYEPFLTRIPDPMDPVRGREALSAARKDELRVFLVEYRGCEA